MKNIIVKIFLMFKAFCGLIYRIVTKEIDKYNTYWKIKLKWWRKVRFNSSVIIHPESTFEGANAIYDHSNFSGEIGYGSYIGNNCSIIGTIGRFTSIAAEVKNTLGVHPFATPYATTSPMFYSVNKQSGLTFAKEQLFDEMRSPITIGNDCWIGQRVFFVGGLIIGDGAVVLAGAIVTKDVPPYAIVGGVPAKILRYRYDEETIKFLLEKKWWDMPIGWLRDNSTLLCDIDKLKEVLKQK